MKNTSFKQSTALRAHEIKILQFISSGHKLTHIAYYYGMPMRAIRAYLRIIFRKLEVRSVRDAVHKLIHRGGVMADCH